MQVAILVGPVADPVANPASFLVHLAAPQACSSIKYLSLDRSFFLKFRAREANIYLVCVCVCVCVAERELVRES